MTLGFMLNFSLRLYPMKSGKMCQLEEDQELRESCPQTLLSRKEKEKLSSIHTFSPSE